MNTGVGAAGGTVTEASGAKVVVPAGALATSTDIAVAQSSSGAPALPAGVTAAGPIYAFTPHGTTFATPATVTVPFDLTKVPAGSTPVLYKTDATRANWEIVTNATVSGATMTGQVSSFSNFFARLPPKQLFSVMKEWDIATWVDQVNRGNVLKRSDPEGGDYGGVNALAEYGSTLPFEIFRGNSVVYSSMDGQHYYVLAWAPHPGPDDDPEMHGASTQLHMVYTYRKIASNATLKFVITRAQLDATDPRGIGGDTSAQCPWLNHTQTTPEETAEMCERFQINPRVNFALSAWSTRLNRIFYATGSSVEISGRGKQWLLFHHLLSTDSLGLTPAQDGKWLEEEGDSEVYDVLWQPSKFSWDADVHRDGGSTAHAQTLTSTPVNVPLDQVPVDSVFTIETFAAAEAANHVQAESQAAAFLRDPVDPEGGVSVEFTGLEPVEAQPIPNTRKVLRPCTGAPDPAAGKVRFIQSDFAHPELTPVRVSVTVERIDGATGEIGVLLETHDDTAIAGSDYVAVRKVVWFHDGQSGEHTITVPLLLDRDEEDTEKAKLGLTVVSGCAALGDRPEATLTIYDDDRRPPPPPTYSLRGTVTGLAGTGLALQTNFINDVQPTANGAFTFPRRLDDATSYSVSVVTQPTNPSQVCTVTNGSGTIAGADVTNVAVACVTPPPPSGIDLGFGSQGKIFTIAPSPRAIAQQSDGKLLTLGGTVVMRYKTDGTPDTTFGTGGRLDIVTGGASNDALSALAVQTDGKIVVAGVTSVPPSPNTNWITMRFEANGGPDMAFGTGGKVVTDFDGNFDAATAVMLQTDDKIVVAGRAQLNKIVNVGTTPIQIVDQDFAVVRYLPDGTLDASFGSGGKGTIDAGGVDYLNAAAMAGDGSIVAVGRTTVTGGTGNPDMAVARFLTTGMPDMAFGNNGGTERIDAGGVVPGTFRDGLTDEALDVALQGGKILVAGNRLDSGNFSVAVLLRLAPGGAIEHNFASAIPTTLDRANGVALQGDGKIVLAGTGGGDFGIARFTTDGAADDTFGTHGLLTVDFFGGTDLALDVLVQSDGRIVAGGTARNGSSNGAGLVRVIP